MGVDAKLFVTCGKDKVVEVGDAVVEGLNVYVRDKLDSYIKEHTDAVNRLNFLYSKDYKDQAKFFTNGVEVRCYSFDVLYIEFGMGESRRLKMFPDCSVDYEDTYKGDKIIFSIGHWGKCDEIMKVVAEAVSPFGDVYYDHNDSDDEDFVKLNFGE